MKIRFTILLSFITSVCLAQLDTIYLASEKLAVEIKEVGVDAVKFTYPKEDIANSIFKNSIQKIVFKSGRVQVFSETTNFKKVNSIKDWELVSISQVEGEVKGLYKLGDVSAKAQGGTTMTGMERIKDRAFKKLKIQAAMMGANIVYMTQLNSAGAQHGYWVSKAAETSLSGVAYSNILPEKSGFDKLISGKKKFEGREKITLYSNAKDASEISFKGNFELSDVAVDGKLFYVIGKLNKGKEIRYRVTRYDNDSFTIVYEDKNTLYNYVLAAN
jgi:hypothetical protein